MATKKEGVARLAAVPLFSGLNQRELGKLWDEMRLVKHAAGHVIMTEGRPGLGFQLLLDGEVIVERKGKKVALGPGSFFGEMSLIDGGLRTATVTAATPVTTAALNSSTFKSMVTKNPDLAWRLLVHMTGRVRDEQSVSRNLTA
jgi:voltage-gated potassium channel